MSLFFESNHRSDRATPSARISLWYQPNVRLVASNPYGGQDLGLPFFGDRETRDFEEWHDDVVVGNWDSQKINIYFVGNVQTNVNDPDRAAGLTSDPEQAPGLNLPRAVIIINDGGFDQNSGFAPQYSPSTSLTYNILEHEMAHYLARFRNRTINGTTYNLGEHAPANTNNILNDGRPPPAKPAVIPGRATQAGTEKFEIWQRISSGDWNNQ